MPHSAALHESILTSNVAFTDLSLLHVQMFSSLYMGRSTVLQLLRAHCVVACVPQHSCQTDQARVSFLCVGQRFGHVHHRVLRIQYTSAVILPMCCVAIVDVVISFLSFYAKRHQDSESAIISKRCIAWARNRLTVNVRCERLSAI